MIVACTGLFDGREDHRVDLDVQNGWVSISMYDFLALRALSVWESIHYHHRKHDPLPPLYLYL